MKLRIGKNGFTLIELMIVIAIIAIIGVVAYPNFRLARRDSTLYAEAGKLEADIRFARQLAIETGKPCTVAVDPGKDSYGIVIDNTKEKTVKLGDNVLFDASDLGGSFVIDKDGVFLTDRIFVLKREGSKIYLKLSSGGKVETLWHAP